MKYSCGCLNVQINVKNDVVEQSDVPSYTDITDEFFNNSLKEVQLNIEGVRIEHSQLVKSRKLEAWMIHQCAICEVYTHASSKNTQIILLNEDLIHDPTHLEQLEKSSDFSPVYRVILKKTDDNHTNTTLGVQSDKYESLQKALFKLKLQLNDYVKREKDCMEQRIRKYEAEQQEQFSILQGKASQDKNAMMNLYLASAKEKSGSNSEDQVAPLNPLRSPSSRKEERAEVEQRVPSPQHPSLLHSKSAPIANKPRVIKAQPPAQARAFRDPEADLFDDDFDPTYSSTSTRAQQPFELSDEDDDNADTDDSESSDFGGANKRNLYSSSVPISVPAWKMAKPKRGFRVDEEMEEDVNAPHDPEDMAASIKALAKSVHSDGTQIFGDLPRSRFKAGGFGKM